VTAFLPSRLARLPRADGFPGLDVRRADTFAARLLGLALLRAIPPDAGLLLPRTRTVHTCGMRFPLELRWLDARGRVIRVDRHVPPGRLRACRRAAAVLELSSGRR
jgi:uncharacterized membrane protein (UPF0127 family)